MVDINNEIKAYCCLRDHYREIFSNISRDCHPSKKARVHQSRTKLSLQCAIELIEKILQQLVLDGNVAASASVLAILIGTQRSEASITLIKDFFQFLVEGRDIFATLDPNGVQIVNVDDYATEYGVYYLSEHCCGRTVKYLKTLDSITLAKTAKKFQELESWVTAFNNGNEDCVIFVLNDLEFLNEIEVTNNNGYQLTIASGVSGKVTFDANSTHRHFNITGSGSGSCSLTNLRLINGKSTSDGGSVSNIGIKLVVSGCCFENNQALLRSGGGIYIANSHNSRVISSTFTSNIATGFGGGGIHFTISNNIIVISSTFTSNTTIDGGGINIQECDNSRVISSTFTSNTASNGGGIYMQLCDNSEVFSSTFTSNTASNGSGMFNTVSNNSSVIRSTFTSNTASNIGGGIIIISCDNSRVISSTFTSNTANNNGGGISFNFLSSNSEVISSTFTSNTACFNGGGIIYDFYCNNSKISNTTFSRNVVTDVSGNGESLYLDNESVVNLNNITLLKNSGSKQGVVIATASTIGITNSLFVCENILDTMFDTSTGVNLSTGGNILYSDTSDPMSGTFNTLPNMFITIGSAGAILNTTLANNGGLTQTHALVASSPAIDFSQPIATTVDQRGYAVSGVKRDCGSFEYDGIMPLTP